MAEGTGDFKPDLNKGREMAEQHMKAVKEDKGTTAGNIAPLEGGIKVTKSWDQIDPKTLGNKEPEQTGEAAQDLIKKIHQEAFKAPDVVDLNKVVGGKK
jgi:hypothetical protein